MYDSIWICLFRNETDRHKLGFGKIGLRSLELNAEESESVFKLSAVGWANLFI